jgi:hypothetical protein
MSRVGRLQRRQTLQLQQLIKRSFTRFKITGINHALNIPGLKPSASSSLMTGICTFVETIFGIHSTLISNIQKECFQLTAVRGSHRRCSDRRSRTFSGGRGGFTGGSGTCQRYAELRAMRHRGLAECAYGRERAALKQVGQYAQV